MVLHHETGRSNDTEHPQAFFCKLRNERWVIRKPFLQRLIGRQILETETGDIGDSVHPTEKQDETHSQDFVVGDIPITDLDRQQMTHQVITWIIATQVHELGEDRKNLA